MVTCLVTGGAGFIGSHLCEELIANGYKVYCVDNLITGNKKNIDNLFSNPRFHFISWDITTPLTSDLKKILSKVDYLYHLASPASPPQYIKYWRQTILVNTIGTYYMLELAAKTNASFLLASTSEVYGNPLVHPQKENYHGNVNPVGTRACYDESKRLSETLTMEYVRKKHLKARIIRIFNTYGPKMQSNDGRVISNFITAALSGKPLTMYGDGIQTRSFCYVQDMVIGIISAMETAGIDGQVINIGNPDEKTIKQLGELILNLTRSKSKLISIKYRDEDDPIRRKPDIGRAKRLLGWHPKTSLRTGLTKTIDYFRSL